MYFEGRGTGLRHTKIVTHGSALTLSPPMRIGGQGLLSREKEKDTLNARVDIHGKYFRGFSCLLPRNLDDPFPQRLYNVDLKTRIAFSFLNRH